MTLFRRVAALCALLVLSLPAWAVSEKDLLPVDEAFGLTAQARDRDRVEISWKIAPGYYLYRHRTTVKAEAGFDAEALQLPAGKKHHDDFFGEVETYRERLTGVLPGKAADGTDTVTLEVRYQGCADAGVCYPPQKRTLQVKLPAGGSGTASAAPAATSSAASPFNNPLAGNSGSGLRLPGTSTTQALPLPSERAFGFDAIVGDGNTVLLRFTPAPGYYLYRDRTSLALEGAPGIRADKPTWPAAKSHRDEHFGDVAVYFDQIDVPLPLRRSAAGATDATLVITFQGCQTDGICYPPMTRRVKLALPAGKVNAAADEVAQKTEVIAPLPNRDKRAQGRSDAGSQPMLIRPNEPALTVPGDTAATPDASADNAQRTPPPAAPAAAPGNLLVLLLFAVAGGLILNLMPCVLPILSLKVLGVAQSGESRQRARSHALWYTAGVLVAFAAIGALVIALPFLLIGFVPSLARRLPRPGAWMETLKLVLAFPMYGTAIWLLWVLGKQRGVDAMALVLGGLVILSLALWWFERSRWRSQRVGGLLALLLTLGALYPIWGVTRMDPPAKAAQVASDNVVEYSPQMLDRLRQDNRVVFVNMTADWCVTCKANERAVLGTNAFQDTLRRTNAVYMRGDYTNVDPQITAFLDEHKAVGVPLYVVYGPGAPPTVLPTVLTQALVEEALLRTAR